MDCLEIDTSYFNQLFVRNNCDLTFLEKKNTTLTIFAELIGIYHFVKTNEESVNCLLDRYFGDCTEQQKNTIKLAAEIVLVDYKNAEENLNTKVIEVLAEIYVLSYENQFLKDVFFYDPFIFNDYNCNKFVDLASGPDFINFVPLVSNECKYYAVDPSLFVASCIQYQINKYGITNIETKTETAKSYLLCLENESIDCVRAKNIFSYDQTFTSLAEVYYIKLINEGMLVFQETVNLGTFKILFGVTDFIAMCQNLIRKGAIIQFEKGNNANPLSFDSLSIIKKNNKNTENEINEFNKIVSENLNRQ